MTTAAISTDDLRLQLTRRGAGSTPSWTVGADITDAAMLAAAADLDWCASPYDGHGKLANHFLMLSSPIHTGSTRGVHVGIRLAVGSYRPMFCAFRSRRRPASKGWRDVPADHGIIEIVSSDHLRRVLPAANALLERYSDAAPFTRSAFVAAFMAHPRG